MFSMLNTFDAAIAGSHPVFGFNSSSSFLVEGRPEPRPDKYPEMFFETVSSDYFATLGARLQQGRIFNTADTSDHPKVVICAYDASCARISHNIQRL